MRKKKSFGQHFLHEIKVIEKIANAVNAGSSQVVEIGPGGGALTRVLLEEVKANRLTLVEADRDLIPDLRENFPGVTIIQADAVKYEFDQKPGWVLVGNLPYNAAAGILKNAFVSDNPPSKAIIMVQKEQADRMRAKPGDMSVLSVFTQLYTDAKKLFDVGAGAFQPPPKVQSTVLELIRNDTDMYKNEDIIALAKAGFSSRRKQLHKNLADAHVASSEQVKSALKALNLSETIRAQELSVEDWTQLKNTLSN
jgi:16S rRNA (adenine1518-N6/adenine1519-N6)-dimethyltransferase